jgi:capsular exopolysaccharide synthesis family protein
MPNPTYEHLAQQANTLSAQIASDKNQLSTLGNQLGSTRKSVTALPADLAQLTDLQRNAKVTEGVVTALHDRYNAAVVGKAAAISDVAVTQPASPESAVRRPSLPINIILGLIVGCVLALGAVFVMEYLDSTFKNEDDVRREIGLPVLAKVPRLTASDQQALPWLHALTFESFLQIVTALRYSSVDPIRTLAVTSPQQSDGKSTLSINLGVAMAEFGPGILLVDGDLRNPALHRHLGIDNGRGFSDVLIKSASLEQLVRHTQYPGLDVLTAGVAVPNSIKLLQADSFNEFVREALARYKLVIFDTPAVLPVLDAVLISAKCDGSVMVISASKTDIRATKTALRRLYGLTPSLGVPNLIGIVLNRVAPSDLDGAKYGGYYRQGIMPLPLTTNGISGDAAAPDQTPPSDQPGDRGSPTSAKMFDRP